MDDGGHGGRRGSEHFRGIGLAQFAEGEGAGDEAHDEGEGEDEEGFVVEEGHGEEGGLASEVIEIGGDGHAGDESEDGEDEGCGGDDGVEEAMGVAHGLEGGVLGQVIVHLGEEDLIDDDHPDHEAHDGAEGEDESDGGDLLPITSFPGDELVAIHDDHLRRHEGGDVGPGSLHIGTRPQAEHADIGLGEGATGEIAEEIEFAGDEVAIGGEGCTEVEGAADREAALGEMGFDDGIGLECDGDGTEARVGAGIEQGGVPLSQGDGVLFHPVKGEDAGCGIASEDEQGAFPGVPRVSPAAEADVHLGGGEDIGNGERLGDATTGEGNRTPEGFALPVHHEEVAGEMSLDGGGAVEEGVLEAQLHEHEHDGEDDAGDARGELERFMAQLTPGQQQGTDQGVVHQGVGVDRTG